eukprot:COSAG01_NODE_4817_length_4724_cov_3.025081_2_plen_85_part_00
MAEWEPAHREHRDRERAAHANACLQRVLPARGAHCLFGVGCLVLCGCTAAVREAWARLGFGTGSHLERLRVAAREGDKLWEAVR